jgi:transposase
MGRPGLRKKNRYSEEFKATAVKLSGLPEVRVQDVAQALDIHPFMLSRWRKGVRDGVIVAKGAKVDIQTAGELKRLRELERKYKILQEEHALLKKAIRFASERRQKSSSSSKQTGPGMPLPSCAGSTASPVPASMLGTTACPARGRKTRCS